MGEAVQRFARHDEKSTFAFLYYPVDAALNDQIKSIIETRDIGALRDLVLAVPDIIFAPAIFTEIAKHGEDVASRRLFFELYGMRTPTEIKKERAYFKTYSDALAAGKTIDTYNPEVDSKLERTAIPKVSKRSNVEAYVREVTYRDCVVPEAAYIAAFQNKAIDLVRLMMCAGIPCNTATSTVVKNNSSISGYNSMVDTFVRNCCKPNWDRLAKGLNSIGL